MKKLNQTNYKLKNSVNRLFFRNSRFEPPTRKYLMHQIKNIILTNKQLNNRFMDFNFNKEYKQMHKTMTKFNSEQNNKKNLVSKLSKENQFFTKSYSNIIASLAIKLDKKNINYQTISNFNQKYKETSPSKQTENFFYEDPLLLSKRKELDNFYANEKKINTNTFEDDSLNYSKKLLFGLDDNSPLNRVIKIIETRNSKKKQNENNENLSEVNNKKNINIIVNENQPLSDRNKSNFKKKKLFYKQFKDINKINEINEIKQLKKYNKAIKNILNKNNHERTLSQKNLNELKLALLNNNNYLLNNNNKTIKTYSNNEKDKNYKINTILSSKNVNNHFHIKLGSIKPVQSLIKMHKENDLIDKEIEKMVPKQSKVHKSIKRKLTKMKKLKGSIQIHSIYKDLVKTKETVHEYEKEKEPKFKYLYSIFCDNKFMPFQREERENIKIKKLDQELFRTVNQFHSN